jgi:hypothetical protein
MSELLESGQHPDADQLSAFVEHVLPAHEQEETLAHLAVCSACRSIVALSLPAFEAQPILQPARRPWLSGWNLVWSGTAALAAMVLVGVLLHNDSSVPSYVPPAQTAATEPLTPPLVLHQQLPNAATKGAHTFTQPTQPPSAAAPRAKPGAPPGRHDRLVQAAPPVSGTVGRIANREATSAAAATTASVSVAAANDALQTENVALRSTLGPDQAEVILSRHPLPSGLHAVSAVANAQQAVAIDAHNALFLSDDGGEHWSAIPPPWQGRAVKVELASSTPDNSVNAIGAGAPFRARPAPVFGLVPSQKKSSIGGEVTDPSGASIPNASVVITNPLTQVSRTARTDGSGHYVVNNLDPGTYALEAEAPGFTSQQIPGVALNPAQQNQLNIRLAVGSLSQTVEVQGQNRAVAGASLFAARRPVPSRFEITTDTGEQWTSTDGRSWKRK